MQWQAARLRGAQQRRAVARKVEGAADGVVLHARDLEGADDLHGVRVLPRRAAQRPQQLRRGRRVQRAHLRCPAQRLSA